MDLRLIAGHALQRPVPRVHSRYGQSLNFDLLTRVADAPMPGWESAQRPALQGQEVRTVPPGPSQALTLCKVPAPRLQYSGSLISLASSGICSNRGCCAR